MSAISYIWAAQQTEPGMLGVIYSATNSKVAPSMVDAAKVPGCDNLVYAESLYEDWRLIGTAKGKSYRNEYGSFVELDTPEWGGDPMAVEDVVRLGWYKEAAA